MTASSSELAQALKSMRGAFIGVGLFSAMINVLTLTGAFYMLQIYDRVIPSLIRGRVMIRIGRSMDDKRSPRVFTATVLRDEERLFATRHVARDGQKSQLRERIGQLGEEIQGLSEQVKAKESEIALIDKELSGVRILWENKMIPIMRLIARERDAAKLGGERAPIMLIVPGGGVLAVEARIQPNQIDQIRIVQTATLRFTAFNHRTTPEVKGEVTRISADISQDANTGMPLYTVRISLVGEEMARLGHLKLMPGMPVESFIQTADRTVVSYLTKPFQDHLTKAWREN